MEIRYLTLDCADAERLAGFWAAALGYQRGADFGQYRTLRDPQKKRPWLVLQPVPEPKTSKNRLHLDLQGESMEAEVARLEELGARRVRLVEEGGSRWTLMQDPEGNEFCVLSP